MARRVRRGLVVVLAVLLVYARFGHATPDVARAALPTAEPAAAAGDRLIVEPEAGMQPIYSLLGSPSHSLDLTMYELVDPTAEGILADDAARGVHVRVLLDSGLEGTRNRPAYDYLRSRGVDVRWSSRRFFATHEKTFVIDDQTAVVMSLNLTDQYYATSRDVAVVDRDPHDAAAIESVFTDDFAGHSTGTPPADDLVWSPNQSEADLLALIASARRTIAVESEELTSSRVIDALVATARRGVVVSVAMTYDAAAAPGLTRLAAAGAHVSVLHGETPLYIHAKLLVVDAGSSGERAFVGSENLSDASLLHDRELGIVLVRRSLVDQVAATVAADVRTGSPWR